MLTLNEVKRFLGPDFPEERITYFKSLIVRKIKADPELSVE